MPIKPGAMYELAKDGRVMLEMQDVMDMVADVRRLEWLANSGFGVLKTRTGSCISDNGNSCIYGEHNSWRDAIDEAMKDD